jgi:hypothetical protein
MTKGECSLISVISHDILTNIFDFYAYPATETRVGHTASVDAPTITEGVSYGVQFVAAEVETANYRHRHGNRNYPPLSIHDSKF